MLENKTRSAHTSQRIASNDNESKLNCTEHFDRFYDYENAFALSGFSSWTDLYFGWRKLTRLCDMRMDIGPDGLSTS